MTTATAGAPEHRVVPRWRRILAVVLLVVGVLLVPVSLSAIWVRNTLLDTDQYVATIGPLAENSDIQQGLADRVTTALFADDRVEKRIADALPPRAEVVAAPIASGLERVANEAALKLFESDQFETVWDNVNRRAHSRLVEVLTGGGSRISTKDGTVSIDMEQIFDNVKQRLDDRGITVFDDVELPAKYQSIVLIQSKELEQAQELTDLLQKLAWILPVVALLCLAGGIALAPNRRRRLMWTAIWVALAVLAQLALLSVGRNFYLEAITASGVRRGSAGAVWDQLTTFLRQSGRTMIVLMVVVAVAAWVAGPSRRAVGIRGLWTRGLEGHGDADGGAFAAFVARSKAGLRIAGAVIALAVLVLWNHPKPITVLVVAILFVVYLAVIELLARGAPAPSGTESA
jgi:hypothetical protein